MPRRSVLPAETDPLLPSAPVDADAQSKSIWDQLDEADRASIERGLAQCRAGDYLSDAEVAAVFALFDV